MNPVTYAMNIIYIPPTLLFQEALNQNVLAHFALFLALILLWTIVIGKIGKFFLKLPTIAGHIIAGILLGPTLLNMGQWTFFSHPLKLVSFETNTVYMIASSDLFIAVIFMLSAILTVPYLLWMAGHETDVRDIMHVGLPALLAGIFGALFPVLLVSMTLLFLFKANWTLVPAIGLGLVFAATSVSIPVAMLFASGKMHLKSSKATLGAAVIDDIVAVILLSLFMICVNTGVLKSATINVILAQSGLSVWGALGSISMVLILVFLLGYTLIPSSINLLKKFHVIHLVPALATISMLLAFSFVELVGGLAGITGAYFAGLFHRRGDKNHKAQEVIAPYATAILLPLFLGTIGFQVNMRFLSSFDWIIVGVILLIAIFSKLAGCWMATFITNFFTKETANRWTSLETYLFGSAMVARGEVGLVVTTILYGAHIFNNQQYALAVVVIILTTIAAPIMLQWGFKHTASNQDMLPDYDRVILNQSYFPTFGVTRLFHIIIDSISQSGSFNAITHIDEGREVVTLEDESVKIILCPEEGIVFEGDSQKVKRVMSAFKDNMARELDKISLE